MYAKSLKIKLIAIFLAAFVCLNAGGMLCVTYCSAADFAIAPAHEPVADHCGTAGQTSADPDAEAASGTSLDCCQMAASFIAAPVEKKFHSSDATAIAVQPEPPRVLAFSTRIARVPPPSDAYRGPPMDRRLERLRQCVIRI